LHDLKVKKLVIRGRKEIFSGPYQRSCVNFTTIGAKVDIMKSWKISS